MARIVRIHEYGDPRITANKFQTTLAYSPPFNRDRLVRSADGLYPGVLASKGTISRHVFTDSPRRGKDSSRMTRKLSAKAPKAWRPGRPARPCQQFLISL